MLKLYLVTLTNKRATMQIRLSILLPPSSVYSCLSIVSPIAFIGSLILMVYLNKRKQEKNSCYSGKAD